MRHVEVGGLVFGEGKMKICVPVCVKTLEEALQEIQEIKETPADLIEWRVDYFEEDILDAAQTIFKAADPLPVLCTFRTKAEGGEREIDPESYFNLNWDLMERGAKMLDLELMLCGAYEMYAYQFIEALHDRGVVVVMSNHDFEKTPPAEELVQRFQAMRMFKADLPKIAVMPETQRDVMVLFSAMAQMNEDGWPLIGISMGGIGRVSRIRGNAFGSAITFATKGKASAPGQIDAETVARLL